MRPPILLAAALLLTLTLACGGSDDDNDPPPETPTPTSLASRVDPTPTPRNTPAADAAGLDAPLYIALGDSLSAGEGATNPATTAFVPLIHDGLGQGVRLLNLGHSGDDSFEISEHGHLTRAVELVEGRNGDDNPNNDVELVTLEIGGNDLLDIFFDLVVPGTCPNVEEGLKKPVCVNAIRRAFNTFAPNLREILDALQDADPNLRIVLMTLYNPFSGSTVTAFEPIGELGLEGTPDTPFPEGLNDIIRAEGDRAGVILVEIYPLFDGRADDYIALDLIHPNDTGYRVMANAVLAALEN
jgi:lysophospholipase L1-like esterase